MIYDLDEYFQEGTGPKWFSMHHNYDLSIKMLNTINKLEKYRGISTFIYVKQLFIEQEFKCIFYYLISLFYNAESVLHF